MGAMPLIVVTGVGAVGFALMMAAYVLAAWKPLAVQPAEGAVSWPLPRRLIFLGALLGVVFGFLMSVLMLIPGGIPWL
jgi:hypothetical protein